jgi:transposase
MRRKKNKSNKSVSLQVLPVVHPNAAGIDVGAKEHVVAVPCDRDPQPVRTFQAFTPELHEWAAWLKRCGIQTVALESTGIYWISHYEVLEQYGFEIRVVNARHVKHVPGRTKTDVLDCQWIQSFTASVCSMDPFVLISRFASYEPLCACVTIWQLPVLKRFITCSCSILVTFG